MGRRRSRRNPLAAGLGPEQLNSVRGVSLMGGVRDGRIVEAQGYIKRALSKGSERANAIEPSYAAWEVGRSSIIPRC